MGFWDKIKAHVSKEYVAFKLNLGQHADYGQIVATGRGVHMKGGSFVYQITPEDALWCARMVVGEGHRDALEVLQTMANRFVFLYPKYKTFTDMCQAYSQPINPGWGKDGWACGPGGKFEGKPPCSPEKLARRDFLANATLEDLVTLGDYIGPGEVNAVAQCDLWLKGLVHTSRVIGAVHFAIKPNVEAHVRNEPDKYEMTDIIHKGTNWFLRHKMTRDWTADTVRVMRRSDDASGGSGSGGKVATAISLVVGIAVASYVIGS